MKLCCVVSVVAALALTALGSAAQAQMPGGGGGSGGHRHQQKANTAKDQAPKADEKAYAAALKTVPNRSIDPWHGVR
jgi:uncharacterized membrane protein YkoI